MVDKINTWLPPELRLFLLGIVLLFFGVVLLTPSFGHPWDSLCWQNWATKIHDDGIGKVYESGSDYMPLYLYILSFYGDIQGNTEFIVKNSYKLKYFTYFIEVIAGLLLIRIVYEFTGNLIYSLLISLLYYLNFFYFYNSIIWSQVDGIMTFLIFLSFWFAYKKSVLLSGIFLLLAINFKLQAIVFIPLIGLLLLPELVHRTSWIKLLLLVVMLVGIEVLLYLPHYRAGNLDKALAVITDSFSKFPKVSLNAFNFWYWFVSEPATTPDTLEFCGVTYKRIGLILFFVSSFFALLPLFLHTINKIFFPEKQSHYSFQKMLIVGILIGLLFFFMNTEMHERYAHPAIFFAACYALLTRRIFIYIILSIVYFCNLERVLSFTAMNHKTLIYTPCFLAIGYFVVIVYYYYLLYRKEDDPILAGY